MEGGSGAERRGHFSLRQPGERPVSSPLSPSVPCTLVTPRRRLEQSEESVEDRMERKRRELLAKDRNNRVSMTDPFKGILPVSDGRSLLDEIFPDGENSHIGPLLQGCCCCCCLFVYYFFTEDSLLKTPPQQRQHPSKEYFAKVLNPQISQPETFQPSPLVSQDVRLREREPERARHSPTRSSGSSERHSAKLVGSLLASSGAQITPVDDRLVTLF